MQIVLTAWPWIVYQYLDMHTKHHMLPPRSALTPPETVQGYALVLPADNDLLANRLQLLDT